MDKLILQDVRCFHGRHELSLAPLTVLVGENSTGKSTLLAAIRLAWDVGAGILEPDFNEEPFDWGAYDQIAHFRGGRGGRAKNFTVGFEQGAAKVERKQRGKLDLGQLRCEATFAQKGAQPRIKEWTVRSGIYSAVTNFGADANKATTTLQRGKRRKVSNYQWTGTPIRLVPPFFMMGGESKVFSIEDQHAFQMLLYHARTGVRPYAIAPIRTKPQRTYEPRRESHRPEGEHVPMILARTKSGDPEIWEQLREHLCTFGKESGLFQTIDIKRLGGKDSDPFQVQIFVSGPATNLVDVGYGISQVLPIAVDCLTSERGQTLLMQQPEVHLHPRAQAQLGSFMGYVVKNRGNRLVLETHSDYLIDRIRLDVRDGKFLRPEDVCLIYCERHGVEVHVHPIRIDKSGNLVDAPRGYRHFFLEEEERIVGG